MSNPANPFEGLPPNLTPNPAPDIPEAPGAGDATAGLSPFKEALDVDAINRNLVFDRPLKLQMPEQILRRYVDYEFRFINDIPAEYTAAHNKGFRKVDDPEVVALMADLVAGTDKVGKAFGVTLFARHKTTGEAFRKRHREQLASLYAGMDPVNREFSSKYAENAGKLGGTAGQFQGPALRIRVK